MLIHIKVERDNQQHLWRVEIWRGMDCVMSRICHTKDQLEHCFDAAKELIKAQLDDFIKSQY